MILRFYIMWFIATAAPPVELDRDCSVTKPDGQQTVVRCYAEGEWWPFEGTRWWVQVAGQFHRVDTYGFESNCGPIYQSADNKQVVVFSTFRNTVEDGHCFDLVTGEATERRGTPAEFEADGWKRLEWRRVDEAK
jgi:hypothetical protein